MIEKLLVAWRAMAARERRLVGAGVTILLLAVGYLLMFEPAWQGRKLLRRELPELRSQLAQMSALAVEARRLTAAPKASDSPQALRAALAASAQAAGLGGGLAQLSLSGELFDLRFSNVPHAAWLTWLDTTLRETQLRVTDLSIAREAMPGVVSVRLVLEFPRRDGR